jgi:hypothetical protein
MDERMHNPSLRLRGSSIHVALTPRCRCGVRNAPSSAHVDLGRSDRVGDGVTSGLPHLGWEPDQCQPLAMSRGIKRTP